MVKIIISGSKGRMGSRIAALIAETDDLEAVAGIDVGDSLIDVIGRADIVVDFSTPKTSERHAQIAAEHGKPIVIGTTGLNEVEEKEIANASKSIPIVYAPNMGIGVNAMYRIIEEASAILGGAYSIDIVETHHAAKKDRPSGTAKRMAGFAADAAGSRPNVTLYNDKLPKRDPGDHDIRILSIRRGDVVGDHEIVFTGNDEVIRISHHAASRDVFARGALAAARWIVRQPPGLYDMGDVLGIKGIRRA